MEDRQRYQVWCFNKATGEKKTSGIDYSPNTAQSILDMYNQARITLDHMIYWIAPIGPKIPDELTALTEWFDIHNTDHLLAWEHLNDNGQWPEGFIPSHVFIGDGYRAIITQRMANAWLNSTLGQ